MWSSVMKIEIPFLAGLLFAGTDLLTRITVQGVEQALFSTVIEYGWKAIKTSGRFLPETGSEALFHRQARIWDRRKDAEIQGTALKYPTPATHSDQSRCAARWRTVGYLAAIVPFLLIVALAWLRPDLTRTEIPDWRPVLALADASWENGDLFETRHLYLKVDRIASWQQDWEGLVAAACGIKRLERAKGPYSKTFAILIRAMTAAESKQSRAGVSAVARAFSTFGEHKAATMVSLRIRPDWPQETRDSANLVAVDCWEPDAGGRSAHEPNETLLQE